MVVLNFVWTNHGQRIFNCTNTLITHFILDKIVKLSKLQSYLISRIVWFLAHCVYIISVFLSLPTLSIHHIFSLFSHNHYCL